jgi:predicted nucleotidyltransferase
MTPGVSSPHAEAVARRVLLEEESRRSHLVVALTGAHPFGFASPDSDLDLKAIHLAPTRDLLGLRPVTPTFDRLEVIDGVEIDYTSNELGMAMAALLEGNGNFLERILGPHVLFASPVLAELAGLARRTVTQRVHRHDRGLASGQLHEFDEPDGGTAKKALSVPRTTLTGAHALRTGEIDPNLEHHLRPHGFEDAEALREQDVERVRPGLFQLRVSEVNSASLPESFGFFEASAIPPGHPGPDRAFANAPPSQTPGRAGPASARPSRALADASDGRLRHPGPRARRLDAARGPERRDRAGLRGLSRRPAPGRVRDPVSGRPQPGPHPPCDASNRRRRFSM